MSPVDGSKSEVVAEGPVPEAALITAAVAPEVKAHKQMRIQEFALPVVVLALVLAGSILRPDTFPTQTNFFNILVQTSSIGVIAVGMTFVIATGGIDLSVGSGVALVAIVAANSVDQGSALFILATVGMGAFIGAINGFAVSWMRIVPFIATLAMLTIARGWALNITHGTLGLPSRKFQFVNDIGTQNVWQVPIPALVFVGVTVIGWVLLNRTRYGRYVVAVGGNREAARIAGIRVRQIIFSVYVLIGLCVGVASVLVAGRLGGASPVAGGQYELQAIAAVVIGGTSLAGGRATMVGTFFGVVTFGLVFNLLNLLSMPNEIQQITQGVIVLVAVAIQRRDS